MDKIKYTLKKGDSLLLPVYNGKTINRMPDLITQGYIPISIAEIIEQRINAYQLKNQELSQLWERNYFDSGDVIMYHPDGRIKIVFDSETLRSINPLTKLGLFESQLLSEGIFDKTQGIEFSTRDIERFANKYLSKKDVLNNPIWIALVRGDKELLKEYTNQVYSKVDNFNSMKIWIDKASPHEEERFWYISSLDYGSTLYGNQFGSCLNRNNGRLIGVDSKMNASKKIESSNKKINLKKFMRDLESLENEELLTKAQILYETYKDKKFSL